MITTVTPNPSLDRTLYVASLRRGAVHRAASELAEPSGKGVNVAVALHGAGRPVTAVLPSGGASGRQLVELLADLGVTVRSVAVDVEIRSNISVIEGDGTTTKFNAPGPAMDAAGVAGLVRAAESASAPGEWVLWCGSLPAGFTEDGLARAVAGGRAAGRRVALDTSGAALAAVLAGPSADLPHLIKPNAEELAELVGRPLATVGDIADSAAALVERGVETVLVSLGADGAVLVDRHAAWFGQARVDAPVNTAGAGDAFLAGYLAAEVLPTGDAAQRLACALRYGAAAVQQSGTLLASPVERGRSTTSIHATVASLDGVRDRPVGHP